MHIGISYDLKNSVDIQMGSPDDALEEYDTSDTVDLIVDAIRSIGHSVTRLGGGREFLENILKVNPDIVFNIAEGRGNYMSREAQVPSVLEMLEIPYTGSAPQCLANCLDKPLSKQLIKVMGISTPPWHVFDNPGKLSLPENKIAYPVIIKPAHEGSSKGIHHNSLASGPDEALETIYRLLKHYQQPVMMEEFISGDEVTVGLVGNTPPVVLGMMRIRPKNTTNHFVYSVEVKRDYLNLVEYECPPSLDGEVLDKIMDSSLKTFKLLGCRDFCRIDFRISPENIPYLIELNPLPGLGSHSDLVIMALKLGWRYETLIEKIIESAVRRYPRFSHQKRCLECVNG